jgi:muramoyltetrapeptide carboxypeptidase
LGGNLSLLASLCGTQNGFDATGKIIFIEDVGEAPRRIDRMLTQLRQAANLGSAAGIILGEFLDCDCERSATDPEKCKGNSLTLRKVLIDRLLDLNVPLVHNFPFGHDENLCTFPVGARVELDATAQTVKLLEAVVVTVR